MSDTKYTRILILVTISSLIGVLIVSSTNTSAINNDDALDTSLLRVQEFNMDDYEPLFDYEGQLRGNITASAMDFQGLGLGFYLYNAFYPELVNDFSSNALNLSYVEMEFINTTSPAFRIDSPSGIVEETEITVLLNETIDVKYNKTSDSDGFLIYCSRLTPTRLVMLEVKKEGSPIEKVDIASYRIDKNGFLFFDYDEYFIEDTLNFSMYLIWEYDLTLNSWILEQIDSEDIALTQQEQALEAQFNYRFSINGNEHGQLFGQTKLSDIVEINLTINPPNKELFQNHTLEINNETKTVENYLDSDYSLHTDMIPVNQTSGNSFDLTFTSVFNVSFVDPVEGTWWSIDRLVGAKSVRERTYFPSITSGPSDIYVSNLVFFERTIAYNQYISSSSLFGREVAVESALVEEWVEDPSFTSSNTLEEVGLNVTVPYMILGETCPFNIRYNATESLHMKITDNIGMPIVGLKVVVEYCGRPYGTFISQDVIQPISSQLTDFNSEILIKNVPNGYYTIKVYHNEVYQGSFAVNSYKETNVVVTGIIHFPIWIIVLGGFSTVLLALGFVLYKKNIKKAKQ